MLLSGDASAAWCAAAAELNPMCSATTAWCSLVETLRLHGVPLLLSQIPCPGCLPTPLFPSAGMAKPCAAGRLFGTARDSRACLSCSAVTPGHKTRCTMTCVPPAADKAWLPAQVGKIASLFGGIWIKRDRRPILLVFTCPTGIHHWSAHQKQDYYPNLMPANDSWLKYA